MTTITTPMPIESRSPRPVLVAVVSAVLGVAIGLSAATLIDSDDPAIGDPVPAAGRSGVLEGEGAFDATTVSVAPVASRDGVLEGEGAFDATTVSVAPVASRGGVLEGEGAFDATSDATLDDMEIPRGLVRGLPTAIG